VHVTNRFTFVSLKDKPVNDDELPKLIPLLRRCPNPILLDLGGTQITDASIELLDSLPEKLRHTINLENTAVSDAGKLRIGGLRITDPDKNDAFNRLFESSN